MTTKSESPSRNKKITTDLSVDQNNSQNLKSKMKIAVNTKGGELSPEYKIFTPKYSSTRTNISIQPEPKQWKLAEKQVRKQFRRMILTINADKNSPYIPQEYKTNSNSNSFISLYKHLEINLFPLKININLVEFICQTYFININILFFFFQHSAKQLKDYFIQQEYSKEDEQQKKKFLGYFTSKSVQGGMGMGAFSFNNADEFNYEKQQSINITPRPMSKTKIIIRIITNS